MANQDVQLRSPGANAWDIALATEEAVSGPSEIYVRVGGIWRKGIVYTRVAGEWKVGTSNVKVTDTWKP